MRNPSPTSASSVSSSMPSNSSASPRSTEVGRSISVEWGRSSRPPKVAGRSSSTHRSTESYQSASAASQPSGGASVSRGTGLGQGTGEKQARISWHGISPCVEGDNSSILSNRPYESTSVEVCTWHPSAPIRWPVFARGRPHAGFPSGLMSMTSSLSNHRALLK